MADRWRFIHANVTCARHHHHDEEWKQDDESVHDAHRFHARIVYARVVRNSKAEDLGGALEKTTAGSSTTVATGDLRSE